MMMDDEDQSFFWQAAGAPNTDKLAQDIQSQEIGLAQTDALGLQREPASPIILDLVAMLVGMTAAESHC